MKDNLFPEKLGLLENVIFSDGLNHLDWIIINPTKLHHQVGWVTGD